MTEDLISTSRVLEVLSYDPETGVFRWKVCLAARGQIGAVAGGRRKNGYRMIRIDGQLIMEHRIAWVFITGAWPQAVVDHVNGIKDDNRKSNLRAATQSQNIANSRRRSDNSSGIKGVSWSARRRKWVAAIKCGGLHLTARFDTKEQAKEAREAWADKLFGEFARAA